MATPASKDGAANDLGLHAVKPSDVARARTVLFEAFREDPFFEYMLGPRRRDESAAGPVHAFLLSVGMRYGETYAPSAEIESVAVWLPPGRTHITTWMALKSGVLRLRGAFGSNRREARSFAARMLRFSSFADGLHHRHAPFPHWYLLAIGVGDGFRGKGYASRLMNPMMDRLDREGMPCYLETHNPVNVGLYEHFGFSVREETRLPESERKQWVMLRDPR